MNINRLRSTAPLRVRSLRPESNITRSPPMIPQSARSRYEHYLALARAEVLTGDTIQAQNYFQHAEHYFRSMDQNADLKS
jgi:hypothetical protein